MIQIGDLIKPTYIDDEWLAQYEGFILEVISIDNEHDAIKVRYCEKNGINRNEFYLFCDSDIWELVKRGNGE